MKQDIEQCEYCGNDAKLTRRMITGDTVYICDLCYEAETMLEQEVD